MQSKYTWIDVVPGDEPQRIHISQHDERSRHLMMRIYASDGTIELPDTGVSVAVEGRKPDGTEIRIPGSRTGLACTFDLPAAAADTAGEIPCKIVAAYNGSELYTETFILIADPGIGQEG